MADIDRIISSVLDIPGLDFKGESVAANAVILPSEAWKKVASFDSEAVDSISVESGRSELIEWFARALESEQLGPHIYISIGGYGRLPWIQAELSNGFEALANLWLSSNARELLVLTDEMDCIIGVTEEEHDFEVHKTAV